jgi:hypothetical protein
MKAIFLQLAALYLIAAGTASAQQSLPNLVLTPGAVDPRVTQANIDQTICVPGWAKSVRPPERYMENLKRQQIEEYGYASHYLSAMKKIISCRWNWAAARRIPTICGQSRTSRPAAGALGARTTSKTSCTG